MTGITFVELLAYNDSECSRWQEWFDRDPSALTLPMGEEDRGMGTIHALLSHIFFCEHYYAVMLQDGTPDMAEMGRLYHAIMGKPVGELFRFGDAARHRLSDFAATANDEQLNAPISIPYPPGHATTGSKRKFLAHVIVHSTRHLAQLATVLRQHRHKTDWEHDLMFCAAIE